MDCPSCGGESSVRKSMSLGAVILRRRECQCGARWATEETFKRGSLVATGAISDQGRPPVVRKRHSLTTNGVGGVGGGLFPVSDPVPDPSGSLVASGSEVLRKIGRARVGRGDAKDYPAEFEQLWAGCARRRGNKHPAFKAWLKEKPPLTLTIERYLLWTTTTAWRSGYTPHLSTWLNARGWQDVPDEAEFAPQRANGAAERPVRNYAAEREQATIAEAMRLTSRKSP